MKKTLIIGGIVIVLFVGAIWWSKSLQTKDPDIVATRGIHWHPHLTIYVKEERQEIPANIGIGPQYASLPTFDSRMGMTAMHTHEPDGTIHFEFPGIVRRDDTKLDTFFRIWGKEFMSFGSSVTMTVNGEINTELENYEMKDSDKIELRYE